MKDHTILSLKRLQEKGPVTRLKYEKRRDASLKRKKSFKSKVKKIDELTTQIQDMSEEVRQLLFELPNFKRWENESTNRSQDEYVDRCVRMIKDYSVGMYEFADDSYRDKYHRDDGFSNSESDMEDYTPSELK